MEPFYIPDEIRENYIYAINKAREDRPRYLNWIKDEIEIAINLISNFDKVAVLGGIAVRLFKATPTFYSQFLEGYAGIDKEKTAEEKLQPDDNIEVLLEYAMSIATATINENKENLPSQKEIDSIYEQLWKIKFNINFWELSAEVPSNGNEIDHWLRTMIVQDTINVRGQGYFDHVKEIFYEIFESHNGFLQQFYGFSATDLFETVLKLDKLVYSKVGNPFGFILAQKRFEQWAKENNHDRPGSFFPMPFHIRAFGKDNPDMHDPENPNQFTCYHIDDIEYYNRLFWVIPSTEKETKIFAKLSIPFGVNTIFTDSKFKAFPQGDSLIRQQPLIMEDGKYFHFSLTLAFRNIFNITEDLIKSASAVYYENYYRSNNQNSTKDNCIERKTKEVFQQLLPHATFYQSLKYKTVDNGLIKENELDILGVSGDTLYIIEVKAGELNTKSRRGAIKGLKDKLTEIVGKGAYQCQRALQYIDENSPACFVYSGNGKSNTLSIDKNSFAAFHKITVTFEQLSVISMELRNLIKAGIINEAYKGAWIVSIYDLLVFRDLIETEADFKEYLNHRFSLYDREDIAFMDEIDVLGFYFDNHFPLGPIRQNEIIQMTGFNKEIDDYYTQKETGFPGLRKPKKKDSLSN